jgi:hypothetical protein
MPGDSSCKEVETLPLKGSLNKTNGVSAVRSCFVDHQAQRGVIGAKIRPRRDFLLTCEMVVWAALAGLVVDGVYVFFQRDLLSGARDDVTVGSHSMQTDHLVMCLLIPDVCFSLTFWAESLRTGARLGFRRWYPPDPSEVCYLTLQSVEVTEAVGKRLASERLLVHLLVAS